MATKPVSSILCHMIILLYFGLHSEAEYFSAIDKTQVLANAEKDLLQWCRKFIAAQSQDFAVYRNFITKVKQDHAVAFEDPEAFLSNPINAYKLIKRTVDEWAHITEYVKNNTRLYELKRNLTTLEKEMQLPNHSDLRGAVKGLGRIQFMYNLSTSDLADGIISGIQYGTELSINDGFEIAANLFEAKEYLLAIEWSKLVVKFFERAQNITESKLGKEGEADFNNEVQTQIEEELLVKQKTEDYEHEYLYDDDVDDDELFFEEDLVYDETNNSEESKEITNKNYADINGDIAKKYKKTSLTESEALNKNTKVTLAANQGTTINNKMYMTTLEYLVLSHYQLGKYDEALSYVKRILDLNPEHILKDFDIYMSMKKPVAEDWLDSFSDIEGYNWFANYSRLCQGRQLPQKDLRKLSCTLVTLNHPLFMLAPLQREQLHADPDVFLYYGLLSDAKILEIFEEADLYMHRSNVGGGSSAAIRDARVSQHAWLPYNSSSALKYISRTVSAISGYDMSSAERLQIVNYGIGGQYDPHHDFMLSDEETDGDRLATYLFYISDVAQGGYTVFPFLNVYSKPVKGALLVWHNLHKSLDPDYRTLHAGCPVAVGTKRICNIWVHTVGQEFRRPCDLTRDNYKSTHLVA